MAVKAKSQSAAKTAKSASAGARSGSESLDTKVEEKTEDQRSMTLRAEPQSIGTSAKTTAPAAASGSETLRADVEPTTEAASKTYEKTASQAKAQIEQAVALTKQTSDKGAAPTQKSTGTAAGAAFKGYDQFAVLGKDNLDALVRSNNAFNQGFERIGKEVMAFAQLAMEENMAQARALVGARNLQEVVDLQNEFARKRLDATIAEGARIAELSTQVANEALEPLQKRVDATVETVLKSQVA